MNFGFQVCLQNQRVKLIYIITMVSLQLYGAFSFIEDHITNYVSRYSLQKHHTTNCYITKVYNSKLFIYNTYSKQSNYIKRK